MHVYELPISLYSFKLRLAIALKGASIECREPPGGTYRSPEFRKINPAGTIPVLVDGALVLAETDTIVEYLDDMRVGAPLLPAGPRERARTRMLSRWCDLRLESAVRTLFPMIAAAARNADSIAAADARIDAALGLIEGELDVRGPFALGSEPGLVDCGLAATMAWLLPLGPVLDLLARPAEKISRSLEAMAGHAAVARMIENYRCSVGEWIGSRAKS